MNSEELELSLRTEFESYLKGVLAEMRQEATEFQARIEAEFDKQRAQFNDSFQAFASRFDSDRGLDQPFRESLSEHLRLARDEGAKVAANAMAEAEKMSAPPTPKYDAVRDAVNDISSKDSQSAILKSLVQHAAEFAPRGAFFIIKSENFGGWKVFGSIGAAEAVIREIRFPTASESILGAAARSLSTVESSAGSADDAFLVPLEFGQPRNMCAMPLVARGRCVAVLYVDEGDGGEINREALETLVRVAGLTVELLAASQAIKGENRGAADFENAQHDADDRAQYGEQQPPFTQPQTPAAPGYGSPSDFSFSESTPFGGYEARAEEARPFVEPAQEYDPFSAPAAEAPAASDQGSYGDFSSPFASSPREPEVIRESDTGRDAVMGFDSGTSASAPAPAESSRFGRAPDEYQPQPAAAGFGTGFSQYAEPVVEAPVVPPPPPPAAVPTQPTRLSDRPVDLPIEVPDEERRIHNDARRFARLLVSEIKLYNEKKVTEGREAQDLYERLREAIDRSREMYDKRVQPPVAAKFDYFHYELVNSLADGNEARLGSNYPGSSV
ncbi:MAG: hypothetical protein ABR530_10910 [Pyrinomonadaceae bacterium]